MSELSKSIRVSALKKSGTAHRRIFPAKPHAEDESLFKALLKDSPTGEPYRIYIYESVKGHA